MPRLWIKERDTSSKFTQCLYVTSGKVEIHLSEYNEDNIFIETDNGHLFIPNAYITVEPD